MNSCRDLWSDGKEDLRLDYLKQEKSKFGLYTEADEVQKTMGLYCYLYFNQTCGTETDIE